MITTILYGRRFLFVLLSVLVPSLVVAQEKRYTDEVEKRIRLVENNLCSEIRVEGEPNWTLQERMKFYHVNGVSIAVVKNYKIEWARGYGWADSAARRPVTTKTLFQAGSMSKSLNAVGVLKLVQEGKLNLEEDINHYLSTWKFPYDSISHGRIITIANLLSHTAGLNVHGFPGYENGDAIPTLQQILDGISPANTPAIRSLWEPSFKAAYSGGGVEIAQLVVQDITRLPYDQFMWENVLKPMGMTSSFYTQPPPARKRDQLATGYLADGKEVKGRYHIYPEQAAAGLWTTPTDIARYIIEIQKSLKGKSNKVLSRKMTELMLVPYKNRTFGLGVFIDTIGGQIYFSHSGQDRGFIGRYFGSADGGNGLVVMTNTDDIPIVNEIINSVAIVYHWKDFYKPFMTLRKMTFNTNLLNSYVGQYRIHASSEGQFDLSAGSVLTVSKEGHHLQAQADGDRAIDIYPQNNRVFFPKTSDTDITFAENSNGVVTKLTIHQNGQYFECDKVK